MTHKYRTKGRRRKRQRHRIRKSLFEFSDKISADHRRHISVQGRCGCQLPESSYLVTNASFLASIPKQWRRLFHWRYFFFKCEPRFRTYWKGAPKQMLKYIQYQFCLIAMVNGSLYESAVCTNRTWNKAAQSKGEPRSVVLNSWSVFSPLFLSVSWSWTLHLLTGTLRWTRAFE